jgi:hypothetical protein
VSPSPPSHQGARLLSAGSTDEKGFSAGTSISHRGAALPPTRHSRPTGNLDSASAFDVLSLLGDLHARGLTLVIVTHDERIATTADRLISMRDGAFVDETHLTGGSRGHLGTFAGWEHLG